MKTLLKTLVLVGLLASSCKKQNSDTYFLKAKVVQTSDISCNLPVLDFSEDASQIHNLTKRNDIIYSVLKLPKILILRTKSSTY